MEGDSKILVNYRSQHIGTNLKINLEIHGLPCGLAIIRQVCHK